MEELPLLGDVVRMNWFVCVTVSLTTGSERDAQDTTGRSLIKKLTVDDIFAAKP